MKKWLKQIWRYVGLGIRWLTQKELPLSKKLLLRLWPEYRLSLALFFFRKNKIKKSYLWLLDWSPANCKEKLWQEKINSCHEVISGSYQWRLPKVRSPSAFNQNILMALHNSAPYDFAGYWYRSNNILKCLHNQGLSIQCATRPGYPWDLQKHRELAVTKIDWVNGIGFWRLSSDIVPYKQGSDFRYVKEYARQLAVLANKENISVIHGHSNYLNGLAAIEAARLVSIASVYEARGFWHLTRLAKEPDFVSTDAFLYEENMEKLALREADRVVTLSKAMKSLIVSWGIDKDKIHVIPNAVDTLKFQPKPTDVALRTQWDVDGFIVGFIGSITPYEGLIDLVTAIKQLRRKGISISLVIAGAGPYEVPLKKAIRGYNFIHYAGSIPHEEVQHWYASFDCCAYPRKNDVVCRYVPPMKVLEAMAMEKPVIVSNLPPLTEMVQHMKTGLVCEPENPKSLASCLLMLMDKTVATKLGKSARRWVKAHRTWQKNGELYLKMYSNISHAKRSCGVE